MAADYPDHVVKLIVGQAPGGSTDVVARLLAAQLAKVLGQNVIVENRTGAAGSIGADFVAKSKPDGYTLLVVSSSFSIDPAFYRLPYDPQSDFAPVSLLAQAPFVLVTTPSFPANSVQDLLKLAEQKPGEISYGSGGTGSSGHMAGALFAYEANRKLLHVPYKGAGPALTDVAGGNVNFTFASVFSSKPLIDNGRVKPLAVSGAKRTRALPNVPTVAESGVSGYVDMTWYGLLAPASTPDAIIERLSSAARTAMQSPEILDIIRKDGAEAVGSTAAEFKAQLSNEIARWTDLVRKTGLSRAEQ